jgi:hypothetical protein
MRESRFITCGGTSNPAALVSIRRHRQLLFSPEAKEEFICISDSCENLNNQIKRRTRVVGVFPSEDSLERLVDGVLIEISEGWEIGRTYLKIEKPAFEKPTNKQNKKSTSRSNLEPFTEKDLRGYQAQQLILQLFHPLLRNLGIGADS